MEEWADILGYQDLYRVSSLGKIMNVRRNREVKPHNTGLGYVQAALYKNGTKKWMSVHRIVATAFIPNPDGKPQVNHKNGVKDDNRVENLEWCTISENLYHRHNVLGQPGGRSMSVVCLDTGETYVSVKSAAQSTGASRNGVLGCCHGKQKATRNKLHFKFKED